MIMKAGARLFEQAGRFHRLHPSFLDAIIIVQPETVIRWHRRGFRAYPLEEQPLATSANVLKVVGSVRPVAAPVARQHHLEPIGSLQGLDVLGREAPVAFSPRGFACQQRT
jgi:hypothetical protein